MVSIIVAYDENRVIGNKGKLPWRLPEDMEFFKRTTTGHIVIMGRKTWESFPGRLRYRINFIISRNPVGYGSVLDGVFTCKSIEVALNISRNKFPDKKIYIIGGSQIYEQFLDQNLVDEIIATEVKGKHEGDTFFPNLQGDWSKEVIKYCSQFDIIKYKKGT